MSPPQHQPPASASRPSDALLEGPATAAGTPTQASLADLATIARPFGEAPLPGAHLGRVSDTLSALRPPHAVVYVVGASLFYFELLFTTSGLLAWTRSHPVRRDGRLWRWMTRLLFLPAAWSMWHLFWGFQIGGRVFSLPATGTNVALRHLVSIGASVVVMLAMEGIWRTHQRLLRGGRARTKLRRAVHVSRARVVLTIGFALVLGAVAALRGPAIATELFEYTIAMEVATGLWLKVTFYQASRALALRDLPTPARPRPVAGQDALRHQTGLALAHTDGMWTAQGAIDGYTVRIAVDPATDPALLGVSVAVPGLAAFAPGLALRGRTAGDPVGIPLGDPILDGLMVAECEAPDTAKGLLGDLHGPILGVLQGWPGSRVQDGTVHLKGTIDLGAGKERVGSPKGVDVAVADALALARALRAAGSRTETASMG